jgi:hypothetical protein
MVLNLLSLYNIAPGGKRALKEQTDYSTDMEC